MSINQFYQRRMSALQRLSMNDDAIWNRDWEEFRRNLSSHGISLTEPPVDVSGRFPEDAAREDIIEFQRLVDQGMRRWRIPPVLRHALDLALGRRSMSSRMLLSNSRVREQAALSLIDAVSALRKERRRQFFFVTLLDDRGNALEYDTALDLPGLRERLHGALEATGLSGFGIVELQGLTNFPQHGAGRTLSFHGHALAWTDDPAFDADAVANDLSARLPLRNVLGAPTVTVVPLQNHRQTTWRAHYMLKAPEMGKRVVRSQTTPSGFALTHALIRADFAVRLVEALSQLEISDVLFATGEGVGFQAGWLAELHVWHQRQLGEFAALDAEGDMAAIWYELRQRRGYTPRSAIDFDAAPSDEPTPWERATEHWLAAKPATRRYATRKTK